MKKSLLLPVLFAVVISSTFGAAYAAQADYYLKIEGIDGESAAQDHKGEIDIQSFSWGVTNSGSYSSGGGGGAGKVSFQDFHFTKTVDKSSPVLMQAAATGEHLKSLSLSVRKAGGQQVDYYKVTMTDVLVSSYSTAGDSGGVPTESISFTYQKIVFEYIPQSPDGTASQSVKASWDLKTNTK